MFWVVVFVIAGIFFSIWSPAFRKVAAGLLILLALVIAGYFLNQESKKSLVRRDQLELTDLRLGPSSYSYALTGRIKNNSPHTVASIKLKVDARDCNDQGHCDTVGEVNEDIYQEIPAGQVRDINQVVYFPSDMRIEGKFEWNYSITEIDAQ